MLYTYETARRSRSNFKRTLARAALLVGLALIAIGFTGAAWGAQTGLSLGNRLVSHQHRSSSDGGILQGFSPVGTFFINTNNVGNITVSSTMAGTVFRWSPGIANLTAGQFTTLQGAYSINLGSYTANIGAENLMRAHYSGALGYGNSIPNWRFNSYFLGNYMTNTANNSVLIGNGDNLYRSVNNSTGTVKIFAGNINPEITATSAGVAMSTLAVTGYISVNGDVISTSPVTDTSKLPLIGGTLSGALTVDAGTVTIINGGRLSIGAASVSGKIEVHATDGNSIVVARYTPTTAAPNINFQKSRGNVISSHSVVVPEDSLGQVTFQGSHGTGYGNGAMYRAKVDGAWALGDNPGRLEFWTTPDGASGLVERMRIDNAGRIGISTGAPQATLDVNGPALVRSTFTAYNTITVSTSATSGDSLCFLGAVDTLPTTGYNRGCMVYLNTDPTKIYLSTETVVGVQSWLGK